ncbi:MAG: hypothetical protein ACI8PZ_005884 [Myxococcota bacterium]|jgi:hypothetical protein
MIERRWELALLVLLTVVTAAKLHAAMSWSLLADEAYYWVWSQQLAWGYYDQPPAIAGWLAASRALLGDSELALRGGSIAIGLLSPALFWNHVTDRPLLILWWIAAPPLAWLTLFATPDALLIGAWAAALAAAASGRWRTVGIAGGIATLCKLTGGLLVPLLLLAAGRTEWSRSRWAVPGALLLPLPWLVWNAQHDWVSVRFPLSEGLYSPHAPGLLGPPLQILGQVGVLTPPLALVAAAWLLSVGRRVLSGTADRTDRLAWWTSAPLVLGFCIAAVGGPPEAHWTAPAWVGVGLGLARSRGRLADSAWLGGWLALVASVIVGAHAHYPLTRLPTDPATRLTEGPVIADLVGRWALPDGVAPHGPGVLDATPVLTERYQEAAFVHYYLGIPAAKAAGCGRQDQYDLWSPPTPMDAVFVKPATGGTALCTDDTHSKRGPHRMRGEDRPGRIIGVWDVWELHRE